MSVLSVRQSAMRPRSRRKRGSTESRSIRSLVRSMDLLRYPWVMVSRLFLKSLEQTVL